MSSPGNGDHDVQSALADIETSSEDYARRFSGATGRYFLDVQERITLRFLARWPGARVLDVGGGHAQVAVPLVSSGYDVTVLGSDESCRERLDRILPSGSFAFQTGNLLKLPYEQHSFDVVMSFRLLSHEPRWESLLAEMCRVARHAVIVDYPEIRSFNILYKLLFGAKKAFEGNTRAFITFRGPHVADSVKSHGFANVDYQPQFFFPMVVHRGLRRVSISRAIEAVAGRVGLRRCFGSPVILCASRASQRP